MTDEDTSQAPEPATEQSKPLEAATAPETAPAEVAEPQTAQTPASEPLPSAPEPIPAPTPSTPSVVTTITHAARNLLVKARATIQNRKHIKLEKILSEVAKKGKITNDEVEKLLHVSDATATRYLSALAKDGKLKQIGKTGKAVVYSKL